MSRESTDLGLGIRLVLGLAASLAIACDGGASPTAERKASTPLPRATMHEEAPTNAPAAEPAVRVPLSAEMPAKAPKGEPPAPATALTPALAEEPPGPTPIEDLLVHLDRYVRPPMKKVQKTKWGVFDRLPFRITVRFCVGEDGSTRDVTRAWAREDVHTVRSLLVATVKRWRFDPAGAGQCSEVVFRGGWNYKWLSIRGPGQHVSRIRPVAFMGDVQHAVPLRV